MEIKLMENAHKIDFLMAQIHEVDKKLGSLMLLRCSSIVPPPRKLLLPLQSMILKDMKEANMSWGRYHKNTSQE
jgi:hypothetical protein